MNLKIREEGPCDVDAVHALNVAAFETDVEAKLVDVLRDEVESAIRLVAERDGSIVGHIMFSPVSFEAEESVQAMGLAPMAVTPTLQRQGIGSALVGAGLDVCRDHGVQAVFVLGHPSYYPRFGFEDSGKFGITSEYDVPEGVFMGIELVADALSSVSGIVRYHDAFGDV